MKFNEFYIDLIKKTHKKNQELLLTQLSNPDNVLIKKIKAQIERSMLDLTVEQFIEEAKQSKIILSYLCKDPHKMGLSEKAQIEFSRHNLTSLPKMKRAKNAIHLGGNSKTLDFINKDNGDLIFAKVVQNNGGGQDNVKVEAKALCDVAINHLDKNIVLLLDGSYFDDETLSEIKSYVKSSNVVITNSDNY